MQDNQRDPWKEHLEPLLKSHQAEWDQMAVWESIEQDLPKEKKRKPLLLWFFAIGFTVASGYWTATKLGLFNSPPPIVEQATAPKKLYSASALPDSKLGADATQNTPQLKHDKVEPKQWLIPRIARPVSMLNPPVMQLAERPAPSLYTNHTIPFLPNPRVGLSFAGMDPLAEAALITPQAKKTKWSMEWNFHLAKPWRQYASNQLASFKDHQQNKSELEQPLESIGLTALVGLHLGNRWSVQAGIGYQLLNERFSFFQTNIEPIELAVDSAFYYLQDNGERLYESGILRGTKTTVRQVNHYNRYHLLTVPLLVNYRLSNGRVRLSAQGGPLFNFLLTARGRTLNLDYEVTEVEQLVRSTGMNLGLQGALNLEYQWTPRSVLKIGVSQQLPLYRWEELGAPELQKKYHLTGLQMGWRYVFN